jgi:short-subunit dehydrogenase
MIKAKLALVTGASSGLGKALCIELAKQGIPLALVARDENKLKELAAHLSVPTSIHSFDLSLAENRQQLIHWIRNQRPDLVINNAGFGLYGPVLTHSSSALNQMLAVNIQAVTELTVESARVLRENNQSGTIINISSAASFFSYPFFSVYAASKAYVHRFSEGLDQELKPYGIRVLTVCPGQIETDFRSRASGNYPQKKDHITMPAQTAARLILNQLKTGKAVSIIDWRYRLLIGIAKWLPTFIVQPILKKSLQDRYPVKD